VEKVLTWGDFYKVWWKTNRNRRRSCTKNYWWHSASRGQGTSLKLGNYSRLYFLVPRSRWMQNNGW